MDIGASNWNESDDNNSTAAPDGAPEGMPPSGVNNTVRAVMGAIKRWYDWSIPKVTGGTSTAYTLTYGVAPNALVDGMMHLVQFHAGNGISATLNVGALGAQPINYHSTGAWRPVPPALFDVDEVFRVSYHAGTGVYRLLRPGAEKTGVVKAFAGSTVPGGYLLCYGQAISRTDYAGLFAVLGTTHGTGDGSTTFNVPDERGRGDVGKSDMGGIDAGNLTGGSVLGASLGAQTRSASISVGVSGSASGTLTGSAGGADGSFVAAAVSGAGAAPAGHTHPTVSVTGSLSVSATASGTSGSFSVVQPSLVHNKIIEI